MKDKNKLLLLILISIGGLLYFIANFQRIAVPGAIFDLLQSELSVTAPYITAFGAIFMYIYALGQLITGVMVDRYGGVRVISCGGIILALGCIIFPLSQNIMFMYFARALIGLGSSMFYLSLVKELKNLFSDKNYGIALAVMLFVGYTGGIAANAPFVFVLNYMSWREVLVIIAGVVILSLFIFYVLLHRVKLPEVNKKAVLNAKLFLLVLHKKHNRNLFSFACCNFGISYVIQTIIGKKFLEDFCLMPTSKAAMFLSIMAVIAAFFNIINATVCKMCHNHRVIFLKCVSIITFTSLLIICSLIYLDIRSIAIGIIFCIIAANASISALLIPVIQQTNQDTCAVTAVSIMNFCFFMMVGILGTLTGFILSLYAPQVVNGIVVYSRDSYLLLFGSFLLLSMFEMYKAAKLSNKY